MINNNENEELVHKLKNYQEKILQLKKSNRCICLKKITNKHNFDLSRLLENHSKKIDMLMQQAFKHKKDVLIIPDSDGSEDAIKMRKNLKDLIRNIKQLEDGTGSQYCYFGFPFLEGHITKEYYIRGPLLLFPISVYYDRGAGFKIKFNDLPIFNHTLFSALEKIANHKIKESFETDFQKMLEYFAPLSKYSELELIQKISILLNNNGLSISDSSNQINEESVEDINTPELPHTLHLKNMTEEEIQYIENEPLKIVNYKIIGSFPQGESAIYRDYEELISKTQNGNRNEFIAHILDDKKDSIKISDDDSEDFEIDADLNKIKDMDLNLILPSDSSQDQVVLSSQNSKITLVRGPPGTGKSQVIVNVISNALSKGQKILVVCQKRVALEIVHQRLGEKGLDEYTILLNKEKEDRAKMYNQLQTILEPRKYSTHNKKHNMTKISEDIDKEIYKYSKIAHALSKEYFGGTTIGYLYTKSSAQYTRRLSLDKLYSEITNEKLKEFLDSINTIEETYKKFERKNYIWKNRKSSLTENYSNKNEIKSILTEILTKLQDYIIFTNKSDQDIAIKLILQYSSITSEIQKLDYQINSHKEKIRIISKTHNISISFEQLSEYSKRINAGILFWNKYNDYDKIITIRKDSIIIDDYEKQMDLHKAFVDSKNVSLWKKLFNSETRKKNKLIKVFCKDPKYTDKPYPKLENSLQNGIKLWNLYKDDSSIKEYILEKPIILENKLDQNCLFEEIKELSKINKVYEIKADDLQNIIKKIQEIFERIGLRFIENDTAQLKSKIDNGKIIYENINIFSKFMTDQEIEIIYNKLQNPNDISHHIKNLLDHIDDFDELESYDSKKLKLNDGQPQILEQCMEKFEIEENWSDKIEQEFYHYWINIIEQEHPILKEGIFDDYKQNREKLVELLKLKSDALVEKIIYDIKSKIKTKSRNKIEMHNKLKYELSLKRRIRPVRKLVEKYGDGLFEIAPCWLASPEIVSNVFPLERNMFDLIIVDEASQLAVERALPFLYRGRRIVIAGDEKQLKPLNIFQNKSDNEEEDDLLEIESLLVLVARTYKTRTLLWHYRSKWQELINFSNYAFYNNSLYVAPNNELESPKPPIKWVNCDNGIWENRSNVIEASKVIDILYNLLKENQDNEMPTVGIITFNAEQRNIILDEIEKRQRENPHFDELYKKISKPKSGKKDDEIFIRNIENVQGDEREIIIFSVGYARNIEGDFKLYFGHFNKVGGENILNVAITRASKEIIVVCSIDPRDMKTEKTTNDGPKRLKDFLQYAKAVSNKDEKEVERILGSLKNSMIAKQQTKHFDSDFEIQICEKLEKIGYKVDTQVGQSGFRIDLAIIHPNDPSRYILGIECDGACFHYGSAREQDVVRQQFLERRGWKIERIWSRKWWVNPDREIQRIKDVVDSLILE